MILVTGYSSGGVTAIYFSQVVNKRSDCELIYVGLSDAAFYDGVSKILMESPDLTAKYMINYFQSRGNDPTTKEIHGSVAGFTNYNVDMQLTGNDDARWHEQAILIGNKKIASNVQWCLKNYPQ